MKDMPERANRRPSAVREAPRDEVDRDASEQRWRDENREALEVFNRDVERGGCFGDCLRTF